MKLVVDANPLISMLIKPGETIFLLSHKDIEFFAPRVLFEEIERNMNIIQEKSRLSSEERERFLLFLKEKIIVIPEEKFVHVIESAGEVCPDEKDIAYFALAMYLNCTLWSNEKKLKEQRKVSVWSTKELVEIFSTENAHPSV